MTIVNSWNEWDPLRHVIVGTVENSNVPPMEPALEPKISKDSGMVGSHGPRSKESIEKANIQLDNFIKILWSHNIKVDNYIGNKLVKYGWGATFGRGGVSCLFKKGYKVWGDQRVHPKIKFIGKEGPALKNTIEHRFVSNISGLFEKFNSWTHLKALDLIDSNQIYNESLLKNIRRVFTRFLKNFYKRKGHREGKIGFLISMFAGLFPLVSYLRAKIYLSGFK